VPKGVDVRHGTKTNALLSKPGRMGIAVGSKVGQVLSISFAMGKHPRLSYDLQHAQARCRCMGNVRFSDEWRNTVLTRVRLECNIRAGRYQFLLRSRYIEAS
jgi:hypothetical protein